MKDRLFGLNKVGGIIRDKFGRSHEDPEKLRGLIARANILAEVMGRPDWKIIKDVLDGLLMEYCREAGRANATVDSLVQTNGKLQALTDIENKFTSIRMEGIDAGKKLEKIKENTDG